MKKSYPIILGVSGASGSIYSVYLLKFLLVNNYRVHLIFTENAFTVISKEVNIDLGPKPKEVKTKLLSYLDLSAKEVQLEIHSNSDLLAPISSGSYLTHGMIILPCSMNTLAAVKTGISNSLITRAADVCIKQGRKLVLAPREMPFSSIHLENMYALSLKGVKIVVPSPAFYNNPQNIDDMINYVVGKILDAFEVNNDLYKRWK